MPNMPRNPSIDYSNYNTSPIEGRVANPSTANPSTPPTSPVAPPAAPQESSPSTYDGQLPQDATPEANQVAFAAPASSTPTNQPPLKQIEAILTDNYGDSLVLTQGESDGIHGILEGLPPRAYAATLQALESKGLLDDYAAALDVPEQERFIEQAESKGYLSVRKGNASSTSTLNPPPGPDSIPNKSELPMSVRGVIQDFNVRKADAYVADFGEYTAEYAQAVEKATTGADLRALGEPALPYNISPSIDRDGISNAQADDWILEFPTNPSAFEDYSALARKSRDILGLPQPGTMSFSLSAEASIDVMGLQGVAKREVGIDTLGRATNAAELTGGVSDNIFGNPDIPESSKDAGDGYKSPVQGSASVKVNDQGEAELTAAGRAGSDDNHMGVEFESTSSGVQVKKGSLSLAGNGISSERTTLQTAVGTVDSAKVELTAKPVKVDGVGELEVGSSFDGQTMEQRVAGEIGNDNLKVKVEGSMKAVFLTQDEIEAILTDRTTLFTIPPELDAGTPWEQIPTERQAELALKLWTPAEWGAELATH